MKVVDRPRRETETSKRRAEIRADAARVFGNMGIAHATMRDVADATGILAGSLYHHFRSKDDLLLEIMQIFTDDILRDMRAVLSEEDDPTSRITSLVHLALQYVAERGDEARILQNDAHYIVNNAALAPIAAGAREAGQIWIAELRNGVRTGALRDDVEPTVAYTTLIGGVYSTLRWYQTTGRSRPKQLADQVCKQLLFGIISSPE